MKNTKNSITKDINVINKEELNNVTGGDAIVVDMDERDNCPNCKSYNFIPVYSERFYMWNKVKFHCCNCKHQWWSLIEIPK